MASQIETEIEALTPERVERQALIKKLTQRGAELYEALRLNAADRDAAILAEMDEGTTPREVAELTGLTIARIYKLRDNGKKRE